MNTHSLSLGNATSSDDKVFRKIGWRLLPILMLSFVAAQLDRVNVGFAKLQMLSDRRRRAEEEADADRRAERAPEIRAMVGGLHVCLL